MAEIEYLILADYVRQDSGLTHIMGAGLDTITLPEDHIDAALRRRSGAPQPGDGGNVVIFGYGEGRRILKVVLTPDEQLVVSVMWLEE